MAEPQGKITESEKDLKARLWDFIDLIEQPKKENPEQVVQNESFSEL